MIDGLEELGLPPLGHNRPPSDIDDRATKALRTADSLVSNANRWAKDRPDIVDDEQAGACQLAIDQLRAVKEDLEAVRKAEIDPFDAAIVRIRLKYKDALALVDLSLATLGAKAATWLGKKREQAKRDADERKRLAEVAAAVAREAAERARSDGTMQAQLEAERARETAAKLDKAAKRGPVRAQIKGDYASKAMSLRVYWHARVVDETAALAHYAKHPDVLAAALGAARKLATKLAEAEKRVDAAPPGFEFYSTDKAV